MDEFAAQDGVPLGRPESLSPLSSLIAASAGGTVTSLFVTPFDVVKTRLQAQSNTISSSSSRQVFAGTLDACSKIIRYEGIWALWSGLPAAWLLIVPGNALYFTAYDKLKVRLKSCGQWAPAVSGIVARTATVCITSPIELMRTYAQAHTRPATAYQGGVGLIGLLRREVHVRGPWALWVGLGPTLLRDVPFSAIYWTCYEYIRAQLQARWRVQGFIVDFLSGVSGGLLAAGLTNPVDVIKTRRQMVLDPASNDPQRMWNILRQLLAEEGPRGLWKGIVPRMIKVAPACAIMIASYELFKKLFNKFEA
jgi:solute carrier family 25 protein 39/40